MHKKASVTFWQLIPCKIFYFIYTIRKQRNSCEKDAWVNGPRKKHGQTHSKMSHLMQHG